MTYGKPLSGEKPVIELAACQSGRHITLSVTDHGPGIPDDQKEAVFRRFYKTDPSAARKNTSDWGCPLPVNWPIS
ncbi:MAG: ATP-binding protein [Blautia marasmi]